jgi:hypothetical protein
LHLRIPLNLKVLIYEMIERKRKRERECEKEKEKRKNK